MNFAQNLFISYAHIDDQPLTPGEKGWITRFHASLKAILSMRMGREAKIWRDEKLQGNDVFSNEIVARFKSNKYANAIMFACEYAVRMDPTNGTFRDSRGVARVLTNDFVVAIEDFQAMIEWANRTGANDKTLQDEKAQRERWIDKLRMGQNPLTDQELETLRTQ